MKIRFLLFSISLLMGYTNVFAQDTNAQNEQINYLDPGYYLVVNAYSKNKEWYAKRYVDIVKKMGHEAAYGFSPKKNLFFVYVSYTENFREALADLKEFRAIEEFNDCWVYVMGVYDKPSQGGTIAKKEDDSNKDGNQTDDKTKSNQNGENNTDGTKTGEDGDKDKDKDAIAANDKGDEGDTPENTGDVKIDESSGEAVKPKSSKIYLSVYHARNNEPIESDVQVIDVERSKLNGSVKANQLADLRDPNNGTGHLVLLCDVFGYRKMQHEFNFYEPDTAQYHTAIFGDTLFVYFEMVRYSKGDLVTLYNVYFHNDAAIMKAESKFELGQLVKMMNENKNYKIRIHGHTNGNAPGKILSLKEGNTNFFSVRGDVKEGFGTAKELSKQRATIIKDYLVSQGIAENRMEIKAWGGKRMLHNKIGNKAKRNVRVEVEILEE